MKEIATLLIILSCFSLAISGTATQADTVKAPDISTIPVFDGEDNDPCWQTVEWQEIDQVWINYGETIPEDDYNGRYKVVWSSQTNLLYFFVELYDDVAVDGWRAGLNAGTYDYDIVEVFIDENKSGGAHIFDTNTTNAENAFSYHLYADIPDEGETSSLYHVSDIAGTGWGNRTDPNYLDHVPDFILKKQGDKYTREFSLKVYGDTYMANNPEASRIQLAAGKIMGMSLAVCDNDDLNENPARRDNFYGSVWVPAAEFNSHWENADGYGTVLLTGAETSVKNRSAAVKAPSMFVFPNPVENEFTLHMNNSHIGQVDFVLYNLLGQVVYSSQTTKSSVEFSTRVSISNLHSGMYFLQTRINNTVSTQKLVKY